MSNNIPQSAEAQTDLTSEATNFTTDKTPYQMHCEISRLKEQLKTIEKEQRTFKVLYEELLPQYNSVISERTIAEQKIVDLSNACLEKDNTIEQLSQEINKNSVNEIDFKRALENSEMSNAGLKGSVAAKDMQIHTLQQENVVLGERLVAAKNVSQELFMDGLRQGIEMTVKAFQK